MASGPRHYWRKAIRTSRMKTLGADAVGPSTCDAGRTLSILSKEPQKRLGWFSRVIGFLTTPFKYLGISGWQETGCFASVVGVPVRDAQHSTDGFWTIDVNLRSFEIGQEAAPPGRFLRVEVEPGTKAHQVCENTRVTSGIVIRFGGAVVVDTDGPFLEVHPEDDFTVQV
jgi:hypothetical protein